VTDALADAIVEARPFTSAAALDAVTSASLGEAERAELYGQLFRQINLNTASEDEIMLISGMTSRMAHEFEEYRPYTSLEQFRREIGKYVDAAEVARLEQYVFIPMNLNTASAEDFMTIPGMTSRMVHEFEEYRPYTSMEQFRREIGKYVDENEVARLESYVTLD
jgi:DNA uptake protein ComE-like DNA-binding protein